MLFPRITYLLVFTILILSCESEKAELSDTGSSHNAKTNSTQIEVSRNEIKTDNDPESIDCEKFWKKTDSLQRIKLNFFVKQVYSKVLADPNTPEINKKFLTILKEELSIERNKRYSNYAIERALMPIFRLDTNQLGVLGNTIYDLEVANKVVEINRDFELLKGTGHFDGEGLGLMGKLVMYPNKFDSVFKNSDNSVYVFTDNSRLESEIISFGYYYDECRDYFHYPLNTDQIKPTNKCLIACRLPLELEFKNYPVIDSLYKKQYAEGCHDCPFHFEFRKTFATLRGVPNLYFSYTDSFPINNKHDYPARALTMKINDDTAIDLWLEDVDLFGCACL